MKEQVRGLSITLYTIALSTPVNQASEKSMELKGPSSSALFYQFTCLVVTNDGIHKAPRLCTDTRTMQDSD